MEEEQSKIEVKFSNLLVEDALYIGKLINIAQEGNYIRGWETIKNLPYCRKMLGEIEVMAKGSHWYHIFDENEPEMSWIYNAHLLRRVVREEDKMKEYLIEKEGYLYLLRLLNDMLSKSSNNILIEILTSIILCPLMKGSQAIESFSKRIEKDWPPNLLGLLVEEIYLKPYPLIPHETLSP